MSDDFVSDGPAHTSSAGAGLPMTTALDLPGVTVTETLGVVYGLVVRSMGFTGSVVSSFKALRRGEISEYTQLLEDSRRHAIDRMVDNARLMGAGAIIAVRFDSSEIGQQFTEIVSYGTAVTVRPSSAWPGPDVQLGDADREQLFERLSRHHVAGHLDVPELERRVGLVAAATTREEAAEILADLPVLPGDPTGPRRDRPRWGRGHGDADAP